MKKLFTFSHNNVSIGNKGGIKLKKRINIIIVFTLIILLLIELNVFAIEILTLKTLTDKETYSVNDVVTVTIEWNEGMQAASYNIKYDSDKLEFKSANIAESFYNTSKRGEIKINWASMNEENFTKMTFEFIAVQKGKANISVLNVEAFADGNIVSPTKYDYSTYGKKEINIKEEITEEKTDTDDNKQENKNEGIINNEGKEDNTIAEGVIPQTGIHTALLLVITLLIFTIIGYTKYKNLSGI